MQCLASKYTNNVFAAGALPVCPKAVPPSPQLDFTGEEKEREKRREEWKVTEWRRKSSEGKKGTTHPLEINCWLYGLGQNTVDDTMTYST